MGDGSAEINGFEDFVVGFMGDHADNYVFAIVDENLDFVDDSTSRNEHISGSVCVENIRRRLPTELERRMFCLVRSANDSTNDIAVFNARAHGFLPKAPVRREKVMETMAPLWMKRFPPAEFGDSVDVGDMEDSATTTSSEKLAWTSDDHTQARRHRQALQGGHPRGQLAPGPR